MMLTYRPVSLENKAIGFLKPITAASSRQPSKKGEAYEKEFSQKRHRRRLRSRYRYAVGGSKQRQHHPRHFH
jgi:hypothetical protein